MKKRYAILALKLLFILASFSFVLWKADITKIWGYIKDTNPLYLLLGFVFMSLAQVVSAYRMRFYYRQEGLELNGKFSIGLYFTSMMLNTVLPGGIGGDGYKIYTIGKFAHFSHLRAFKIALSERGNGLFVLLLLTSIFYIYTNFHNIFPHQDYIIVALTILLIPSYFISIQLFLKEKISTGIKASFYSFPVQMLNVAVAFVLLIDLGVESHDDIMGYLVIFMVSSVASILPLTIGGAGIRELTFLYGAKLTGLNAELGITIAFLFFIINAVCSLNGLLFWHRLEGLYEGRAKR